MKKKTLVAALLASASLCSLPALAQDYGTPDNGMSSTDTLSTQGNYQPTQPIGSGNWFVNARVGQSHINEGPYNDHPTAYALNGGYRWKVGPDLGLGIEVGYNDMGNYKLKNVFNSNDVNLTGRRQELRGWTAGFNGRVDVWQGLYVSGRAGVYGWKGAGYSDQTINRHDLDQVDYYLGIGAGYDFDEHFGLGLAYDYYQAGKNGVHLTTDTLSLTGEYRF